MRTPVHVIVDGGLDDALALGVLFGLRVPIAQVIATEGSLALETTAAVTRRLAVTFGSSVPVRLGTDRGLAAPYPQGRDPFHGPDGFGSNLASLKPAATPTEVFHRLDGPVFCAGALTAVARGLAAGHHVTEVVWMGGAVGVGGNMTAAAEFNAWMDPPATDRVMESGIPVRMVPLDVTSRFSWSESELEDLRSTGGPGSLLAQALSFVQRRDQVFTPHDAVAAIAMTCPELFTWRARPARCETAGSLTAGATIIDRRSHAAAGHVLVAEDVQVAQVSARILEAISSLGDGPTEKTIR
jgi:pyrimidine-specific ribonucleoside hydrolase